MRSEVYNVDVMEYMKTLPDKCFDLVIADPPYGSKEDGLKNHSRSKLAKAQEYTPKDWDKQAMPKEFFDELIRVSKNQIIWGGNYFELPPTRCFVIWKKLTISENFTMAMAEYAWTSFNDNAKVFECAPQGKANEKRFHPTQKPVALYEWILNKYAKPGDIILDTHVGSASSLIACRNTNHKYVGFEIDEEYYRKAKERVDRETAQMNIFDYLEEKQ
jgi:site-specific DNA-methyltransferase (adenine-specific)